MPSYKRQTDIQDTKTIRIGSVKFEIGPYGGGYSDVGALMDASFIHSWDDVRIKSDNAGVIEEGITNEIVTISGIWQEVNVANLGIAFAGIGTPDTVAAAPANITDETLVLTLYALTELAYKNGDGTEVTNLVVGNDATPTTTWVRDCDYVVGTTPEGYTTITRAYPALISDAEADVSASDVDDSFNDASGSFGTILAPGDHITVSGFVTGANSGVHEVVSATDSKIIVTTTLTTEGAPASVTITRGGIPTGATVYVDYTYTPLTSRTISFGGLTSKTARIIRLTNTNVAGLTWIMLVHKAYIGEGLNLQFPPDDDRNPLPCPITFVGVLDDTRTSNDQLFKITDTQDTD